VAQGGIDTVAVAVGDMSIRSPSAADNSAWWSDSASARSSDGAAPATRGPDGRVRSFFFIVGSLPLLQVRPLNPLRSSSPKVEWQDLSGAVHVRRHARAVLSILVEGLRATP